MTRSEITENIIETIIKTVNPLTVYQFGSTVTGKQHKNSDIDFCIIKNRVSNKQRMLSDLRLKLWDIPYPLDLILMSEKEFNDRNHLWWTIQGQVQSHGKKVYEKPTR